MKILVVEDEMMVAKRLIRLIKLELNNKILSIHHCLTLADAEDWLSEHTIDLLFLDLNLNGVSGFTLLKKLVACSFQTIIVSANTDQAFNAFEYGVVDFIGKPFDQARLAQAFERLNTHARGEAKFLSVKKPHAIELINVSEVCFVKAAGNYSEIVLIDGNCILHEKNLEKLAQLLPEHFFRVHKSYLVDMNQVKKLHIYTGSKYELELNNEAKIPVGRTKLHNVKERMNV